MYVGFFSFCFFGWGWKGPMRLGVCGYVGGEGVTREGRQAGRQAGEKE